MRGISINEILHLHVRLYANCIFTFKVIYKLNICVCANVRIVYLHISQFTFQYINQYPAEMLCMKYEQLKYCQTIFQNKNQSLVFQSCLYSQHLPGTPLNAVHIFKIYQKDLTFLMVVWN